MIGRRGAALFAAVLAVLGTARAVLDHRVDDATFPSLEARSRVGSDWGRRNDLEDHPVAGEVSSFSVYDRPGFDADAVHPEVRRFYERTADYALSYETIWRRPFRLGARLASVLTGRLEQLNLPGRSGTVRRLESDIAAIPRSVDPRGSRVRTRMDPDTGEAVFVAVYATHERDEMGSSDGQRRQTTTPRERRTTTTRGRKTGTPRRRETATPRGRRTPPPSRSRGRTSRRCCVRNPSKPAAFRA